MAIPTALMRGHTHAGEGSLYCQQAFGCPAGMPTRRERTLSKINLSERRCEHAMRREGTPGSAGVLVGGHRFAGVGMPRAGDSPHALRSPQRSSTGGGESRGVINGDLGDLCSSEQCPRLGL